jgi:hypothetical protein
VGEHAAKDPIIEAPDGQRKEGSGWAVQEVLLDSGAQLTHFSWDSGRGGGEGFGVAVAVAASLPPRGLGGAADLRLTKTAAP